MTGRSSARARSGRRRLRSAAVTRVASVIAIAFMLGSSAEAQTLSRPVQMSDLDGGFAEHTYKLPNPFYFVP